MNLRRPLSLSSAIFAALFALAGCQPAQDPKAAAEAQAAAKEQAAAAEAKNFDAEYGKQNWELAAAYGEVITSRYAGTPTAARVQPLYEEATGKAKALREQRRVTALWSYVTQDVKGGKQLSAAIYAKANVDVDGSGAKPVQLIFRDHPEWGRSSYLVLKTGDFNCYGGCKLKVGVDGKVRSMAGSRPKTDEAIAMFVEDERGLWRMIDGAKELSIEFPVKAGGTRTATFEVGGLDRSRLPAWK